MIVLGIDPGSVTTGWALLKAQGNKIHYISSGVLKFDSKVEFMHRLAEIKSKSEELMLELNPDEIALESLIFVKSPTSLIKLAQTRGVIISSFIDSHVGKVYEYAPNLIKSTAVGHGHADKQSIKKFLDMMVGKREYETHDESDAVAIALCHIINKGNTHIKKKSSSRKSSGGLAASLAHKIG